MASTTGFVISAVATFRMWHKIKNYFYYLCEHYGGSISCWAWHKRWNRRNQRKYTHSEEMQNKLEPIEDDWWERNKSYIEHRKKFPYYPDKK